MDMDWRFREGAHAGAGCHVPLVCPDAAEAGAALPVTGRAQPPKLACRGPAGRSGASCAEKFPGASTGDGSGRPAGAWDRTGGARGSGSY